MMFSAPGWKKQRFFRFYEWRDVCGKAENSARGAGTGRVEDIRKAMNNSEFRRKLYRECGIDGGSRE